MSVNITCEQLVKFLGRIHLQEGAVRLHTRNQHMADNFNSVPKFLEVLNVLTTEHSNFPYLGASGHRPVETIELNIGSFRLDESRHFNRHLNFSMHGDSTFLHADPPYKLEVEIVGKIGVKEFFELF